MRIKVYADEIKPGDVIRYHGRAHRITDVEQQAGWAWPLAADGTGWAIALDHHVINISRN